MSGVHCEVGFCIPHGFRFDPTDEEVIKFYLIPSIHHQELECNILRELEIYGDKDKEPWKLFGEKGKVDEWVLTQVSNKSKSRIERSAGCGTWKGQNNYPIKDDDENVIGRKRYFCFDCKDRSKLKGQWGMHEYALEDYKYSYVICHIENGEDPKKKKRKTSSRLCEDQQQQLPKRLCYQIPSAPQIDQSMMLRTTCSPQWCNVDEENLSYDQVDHQQVYQQWNHGDGGYLNLPTNFSIQSYKQANLEAETQNIFSTAQNPHSHSNFESNTHERFITNQQHEDEAQLPTVNDQQPAPITDQLCAENQREIGTAELEKQTVSSPVEEELSEADMVFLGSNFIDNILS